jgi:hypothetical protein
LFSDAICRWSYYRLLRHTRWSRLQRLYNCCAGARRCKYTAHAVPVDRREHYQRLARAAAGCGHNSYLLSGQVAPYSIWQASTATPPSPPYVLVAPATPVKVLVAAKL